MFVNWKPAVAVNRYPYSNSRGRLFPLSLSEISIKIIFFNNHPLRFDVPLEAGVLNLFLFENIYLHYRPQFAHGIQLKFDTSITIWELLKFCRPHNPLSKTMVENLGFKNHDKWKCNKMKTPTGVFVNNEKHSE